MNTSKVTIDIRELTFDQIELVGGGFDGWGFLTAIAGAAAGGAFAAACTVVAKNPGVCAAGGVVVGAAVASIEPGDFKPRPGPSFLGY